MVGKTIKLLKVFVGGPGDCEKFKLLAREAATEVNKTRVKEEIAFQIVTSEDVNKRQGNAQNQINTEIIDDCDVFLTFFSARCGTPTGNSEHESGSIEEFYRVQQRVGKENEPVIKVFFDSNPLVVLNMPEVEQLSKLLKFKQKITDEHSIYYETFAGESDCAQKLRIQLNKIIDQNSSNQNPNQDDQYKKVPSNREFLKEDDTKKTSPASQINTEAIEAIRNSLTHQNVDGLIEGLHELEMFEKTRLKFLLHIAMSDVYGDELLNNHHINVLYKNRERLLPTNFEKQHLFRTLLHNRHNTAPGWYWLKNTEPTLLTPRLTRLALHDPSVDVRKSALDLLNLCGDFPSDKVLQEFAFAQNRKTFILNLLQDDSQEFVAGAIDYLKRFGCVEDIKTIQSIPISDSLHGLIANLLAKEEPDEALEYILKNNINADSVILASLRSKIIDKNNLLLATTSPHIDVILFALEELISRFDISNDFLVKLLADGKPEIKEFCLRQLIKRGVAGEILTADLIRKTLGDGIRRLGGLFHFGPNTDDVVQQLYEAFSDEKLLGEITWLGIDADIAYEVFAKRKPEFLSQVREDLRNNFDRIKTEWEQEISNKYDTKAIDEINYENKESVEEYVRNKFRVAALNVLSVKGNSSDLEIARNLVQSEDHSLKEAALKIIQIYGDETDMKTAWEIAKNSYGTLNATAEDAFFDVAPKNIKTVLLAIGENASMTKKGLEFAFKNKIIIEGQILADLFLNENEMIRKSAISYLIKTHDESQLIEWLNNYLEQDSYYYDVVCWLDRMLYAIEPFKTAWKQKLLL